ncbi:MAG TPA: hypothetical protein VMV61_05505 [Patescibacteria group bacterium]|nr:hypothetical protein [Patescibacteria group bacterium]
MDSLRFLRYLYAATMGLIALLALAGEALLPHHESAPEIVVYVLYAVAAGDLFAAVLLRRKFAAPAVEILRTNPKDEAAMMEWMKGQLLPLPMALSVGMMGLACRALGAPAVRAAPLYAAAVILLMALMPKELPA